MPGRSRSTSTSQLPHIARRHPWRPRETGSAAAGISSRGKAIVSDHPRYQVRISVSYRKTKPCGFLSTFLLYRRALIPCSNHKYASLEGLNTNLHFCTLECSAWAESLSDPALKIHGKCITSVYQYGVPSPHVRARSFRGRLSHRRGRFRNSN